MALRIHDNLSRKLKDFVPVAAGRAGLYVCGMTVQGPPHVGHLRAAVFGDVVRRLLTHRGYAVTLVHNFTDVDDKIIERAVEENVDYRVIAERNIAAYVDATERMNVPPPDVAPKASEHMPEIIALIADLIAKGHAYAAGGDVYFAVNSYPHYGQLSGRRVEELRAGARIEIGELKRAPEDFALWKGAKPGEPAWPSPWGGGRPGWHIECSAMAMRYLGPVLDLHGGGMDLVFPHHENELAQSEAATGKSFANHWIQHGLVNLGGEKMSKSTQHFFLAADVFREVDPAVVRYYLMTTHYRSPIEFSLERLREADIALRRLKNFVVDAAFAAAEAKGARAASDGAGHPAVDQVLQATAAEFEAAIDDDLNTARAMAALFELVRDVGRLKSEEGLGGPGFAAAVGWAGQTVLRLGGLLGLVLESGGGEISDRAETLRAERERARTARDWARADALRAEILALGYAVEDHPGGSRLKQLQ